MALWPLECYQIDSAGLVLDARRAKNISTRILVVEDDPGLCEFIREVLSSAALDAEATTDSVQAATRLRTVKIQCSFH